jgi:hypothetical protein
MSLVANSIAIEDSPMTDMMMQLQAVIEKTSDADMGREMIGFAAHRLMEMEVGGADRRRPWREKPAQAGAAQRLP